MADIVNPGFLGSISYFKKTFEYPIMKSKDQDASDFEKELGKERSGELVRITSDFVLRRTAGSIADFLPPKIDVLLFVKPNELQISLYEHIISSGNLNEIMEQPKNQADTLSMIMTLRKIANSPKLVMGDTEISKDFNLKFTKDQIDMMSAGSKLDLLASFLKQFKATNEKAVIVSNFTQTLNLIQDICQVNNYTFKRLDGKTSMQNRSK